MQIILQKKAKNRRKYFALNYQQCVIYIHRIFIILPPETMNKQTSLFSKKYILPNIGIRYK